MSLKSHAVRDFNTCDGFLKLIVTCHILTASLEVLGMDSLTGTSPAAHSDPQNMWMETNKCRKEVFKAICEKIVDCLIHFQFNKTDTESTDKVHKYGKQMLSLGCFYLEYSDAIQEGDGDRVVRCWRYLLPIFKSSGRKNYSIEALNMLYQYQYKFTPRQSAQLIWNRFINIHGLRGRNTQVTSSLCHQEHLNRIVDFSVSWV